MPVEPLVSVCMTAYNHEAYIAEAIEGVLTQRTSFGVELVIGEDCSTDATMEICRGYADRYPDRIRIVSGERNIGWRANYRRTVEACRGRYVAMCDGDDWWCDERKLQMQVELIESDPACGMCYTRSERRDENGHCETYPAGSGCEDFDGMLMSNPAENCTVLALRELILRYYSEVRPDLHPEWLTDDLPMWLWFAARSRYRFLDRTTAVHRVLRYSVSHSPEYGRKIAFCDSLSDISLWYDEHYGCGRNRRRLLRRRQNVALWVLSYNGSAGEYAARWRSDVARAPLLIFNAAAYVLFAKKILYRMWKKR